MAKFEMHLSLNVLNHLGINLYSNVPAVLAEVVANGWDADAEKVTIDIQADEIVITDDGHGMTAADINDKFLFVGYERRKNGEAITPRFQRRVMGRKGIGKLSLFSIADVVEVQSARKGEKNGFIMSLPKIREQIDKDGGVYEPDTIEEEKLVVKQGTRIVLKDLRKKLVNTEKFLKRRLARRFSVIGPKWHFEVEVNGKAVTPEDRDIAHKLQYLWYYGEKGEAMRLQGKNLENAERREIPNVQGWIGSVLGAGDVKDDDEENLNRIVVMVRGKLAQEDILEEFNQGGVYTKYLMGEIHADFLDLDDRDDIATSSRQSVIKDDPRYEELKAAIKTELAYIKTSWNDQRGKKGETVALEIPAVADWYKELKGDDRRRAKDLFGRINQLTIDDDRQRRTLIKHGVLAFEGLRYRKNLDALQDLTVDNLKMFGKVFGEQDDLEATLYHQIITSRIEVVRTLQENVDDNVREKVVQQHVFNHLWLLDPAWERATQTQYMEQRVEKEFGKINARLSAAEKKARIDIKYRKTGGRHVIIELKRAGITTSGTKLLEQVTKYRNALDKLLDQDGRGNEVVEIICIVGKPLSDWETPDARRRVDQSLAAQDTRVVLYSELIENAYKAYQEYLDQRTHAGRVFQLISAIESSLADEEEDEAGDAEVQPVTDPV